MADGTIDKPVGGRPPSGASRARAWFRSLVDDPVLRKAFEDALRMELSNGKCDAWFKAVEHGYGRAPQSLKITGDRNSRPVFTVQFENGDFAPTSAEDVPAGDVP